MAQSYRTATALLGMGRSLGRRPRRGAVRSLAAGGQRRRPAVAVAVAAARVPGLGVRQRKPQATGAARLLGLAPVVVAAPEVLAVVIVVAQPEEPHQPDDERSDVEDAEADHEDPPLQRHSPQA